MHRARELTEALLRRRGEKISTTRETAAAHIAALLVAMWAALTRIGALDMRLLGTGLRRTTGSPTVACIAALQGTSTGC